MYVGRPIDKFIGALVSQSIIDRVGLASQQAAVTMPASNDASNDQPVNKIRPPASNYQ